MPIPTQSCCRSLKSLSRYPLLLAPLSVILPPPLSSHCIGHSCIPPLAILIHCRISTDYQFFFTLIKISLKIQIFSSSQSPLCQNLWLFHSRDGKLLPPLKTWLPTCAANQRLNSITGSITYAHISLVSTSLSLIPFSLLRLSHPCLYICPLSLCIKNYHNLLTC